MDDTDIPCRDLRGSKQKHPEKGHSSIEEIGKDEYDIVLSAEKGCPENVAVKETEIESESGSMNKSQGCDLGEKVYSQQTLELNHSMQVSDGEEDLNEVDDKLRSAYIHFDTTCISDSAKWNEKDITLKKPDYDTSSYKSCRDRKNNVDVYHNLKAQQLSQRGSNPAINDQADLVFQSQLDVEVNRSSHEFQLCDDSDPHKQTREELLKNPCEKSQSEECTVPLPENVKIKDDEEDRGCSSRFAERDFTADCFTEEKVEDGSCLQIGQQLTMPGRYHRKAYRHHAILSKVVTCQGQFVELELFHLTKRNGSIDILKTIETYDLATADLRIIVCQYQRYSPNEIIQRAESMLNGVARGKFKKYNLITNNCEHFAMWCAVGIRKSFQVKKLQFFMKTFSCLLFTSVCPVQQCEGLTLIDIVCFVSLYNTINIVRQCFSDKAICLPHPRMNLIKFVSWVIAIIAVCIISALA